MKLNVNGETILVDFKYERDVRSLKEGDSLKYNRIRRHYMLEPVVDIVKVTCTIKRALFEDCIGIYTCDVDKLNKSYVRKISLKNALNDSLKGFKKLREDIWTKYFLELGKDNYFEFSLKDSDTLLNSYLNTEKYLTLKLNNAITDNYEFIELNKTQIQNLIKSLQKQLKYLE